MRNKYILILIALTFFTESIGLSNPLLTDCNTIHTLRPMAGKFSIDLGKERREGFEIIFQSGLGDGIGREDEYTDDDYIEAGAEIKDTAEEVWSNAHIVIKVKEPLIEGGVNEFELMKGMAKPKPGKLVIGVVKEIKLYEGRAALLPDGVKELIDFAKEINFAERYKGISDISKTLVAYFHFAGSRELTEAVMGTGCNALALEAITGDPLYSPLFSNSKWIVDTETGPGEAGRILVPYIILEYKDILGETLPCLDPMSIVAGLEAPLQGVVYLDEDKVKIDGDEIDVEDGWEDLVLNSYPDSSGMNELRGKTTLITGAGTAGLSALWNARRLGSKIVISDLGRNIEALSDILSQGYGSDAVAVCDSGGDIDRLLKDHDIVIIDGEDDDLIEQTMILSSLIIGAALDPKAEAPKTIRKDIIRRACDKYPMRRLFVDISKDQGGNFDFVGINGRLKRKVDFTYHHDPVRLGYKNTIYYLVANMPGRPGVIAKAASKMLQASRLPYLKKMILHGLVGAAKEDPGFKAGLSVIDGELTDEIVAGTKGFGFSWTSVDEALEKVAANAKQRLQEQVGIRPTQMNVADYIVKCLEAEGVEYVFGIPGEEILYLMDALRRSEKIKFIQASNERGAALMADVYGRIARKPAVVLTTLGPGATDAVTGITDAFLDSSPVVMIAGQSPTTTSSVYAHQYVDLVKLYLSVTKHIVEIRDPKLHFITNSVSNAFTNARMLPQGPSLIILPKDIASSDMGEVRFKYKRRKKRFNTWDASLKDIGNIAYMIKNAKCPVIIAGKDLLRAEKGAAALALTMFSKKHKIPITTTFMGKGTVPVTCPTRLPPINAYDDTAAQFIRKEADLVITVGYDTVECDSSIWNPNGNKDVVSINYFHADSNGTYDPKAQAVGNVKKSLLGLSKKLGDYKTLLKLQEEVAQIREEHDILLLKARADGSFPMNPLRVVDTIRKVAGKNDIVVTDVGEHKMLVGWYYPVNKPSTAVMFNGLAPMGGAIPGAIGARLAAPARDVIAICGDGGFMMSSHELRTAAQENIPLVVVIMEDRALGLIKQKQLALFGRAGVYGVKFSEGMDLVKVAQGWGAEAVRVDTSGSLKSILKNAQRGAKKLSKPHVVIVPVDYSDDLPRPVTDLFHDGEITFKADDGREFLFKFRAKEVEHEGIEEDLILEIFAKKNDGEKMIGYVHASLYEDRDWDKWVSMRCALEENELTKTPFAPAIRILDEYKNIYKGIGRTAMSLMLQIAQLKKAYRFVAEEANRDESKMFFSGLGFVPYIAEGSYLEFILYPAYMRTKGIELPLLDIRKEVKGDFVLELDPEVSDEAARADIISRKARGDRYIYIFDPNDGSIERVMRFSDFERLVYDTIVPEMWHGKIRWFYKQQTQGIDLAPTLIEQIDSCA